MRVKLELEVECAVHGVVDAPGGMTVQRTCASSPHEDT